MMADNNLNEEVLRLRSQIAAMEQLLEVHETTVFEQSDRLEQALELQSKRAAELETVAQVSAAAASLLETDELLQTVVDLTKSSFELYHAHIYLLDESGQNLELIAGAGEVGQQMVAQGWQIDLNAEQSLVAQAARGQQGVIVNDVRETPGFMANPLLPETVSEMAIPLVVGDNMLGVLDVQSAELNHFTEADISIMTTLGSQVAIALQNSVQYAQTQAALVAIQENETQLTEIMRIASMANWEFDLKTATFTFNDQFYNLLNTTIEAVGSYQLPAEEFVQKFIHPEDAAAVVEEIGSALTSTDPDFRSQIEYRVICGDGTIKNTQVDYRLDFKGDQPVRAFGSYRDITERTRLFAQTQEALTAVQTSEAQLNEALEIAKLGYWEFDFVNDEFILTDNFYAIFHTTAEEMGGYRLSSAEYAERFVHPEDAALVGQEIERTLAVDDLFFSAQLEHRILYQDGGIGYITVNINVEKDEDGNILRWYGANQDITERKQLLAQTQEALTAVRESETLLTDAMRVANMANWIFDLTTQNFIFNERAFDLIGTSIDELGSYQVSAEQYVQKFVHPEDAGIIPQAIQAGLASDDPANFRGHVEYRLIRGDGVERHFSSDYRLESNEQGDVIRGMGSLIDITERKQAEEALRQVSELQTAILDGAAYGIISTTPEGVITTFNAGAENMLGYKAEEVVNKETAAILHELSEVVERAKIFSEELEYEIEPGFEVFVAKARLNLPNEYEWTYIRKDGSQFPVLLSVTALRDANGEITGFLGIANDITERKQAEEALSESQARSQIILETITIPMVITRLSDNILTFANQPAADLIGVPLDEFVNQPSPNFYYNPETRQEFIKELQEKGFVTNMQLQLMNQKEEPFWALVSARVFEYQGNPSILSTVLDISERIEAQETITKRAAELATVAEVGTRASTILDDQELIATVVQLTQERFNLYHCHIFLADENEQSLQVIACGWEADSPHIGTVEQVVIPINQEQSLVARAAREQRAIIVNDVQAEPNWLPNELLPETRAEMAVPLIAGNRVLGVLDVQANQTEHFTEEDISIMTTLASQVAVALQNAQQFQQTQNAFIEVQRSENQLTEVMSVAKMANWEFDLKTATFTFNDQFYNLLNTTIEAVGSYQLPAEEFVQKFIHPEDAAAVVEEIGSALTSTDPDFRSQIEYRVICGDGTIKNTQVDYRLDFEGDQPVRAFGSYRDITERTRLFAQTQEALEELTRLQRAMSQEGWQAFMTAQERPLDGFVTKQGGLHPIVGSPKHAAGNGDGEEATSMMSVNEIKTDKSAVVAPMNIRGVTIGGLGVRMPAGQSISAEDQEMLTSISDQVAQALETARLFEQSQLTLAQTETLYEIGRNLNLAENASQILDALSAPAKQAGCWASELLYISYDNADELDTATITAHWQREGEQPYPSGMQFKLAEMPSSKLLLSSPNAPIFIENTETDERVDDVLKSIWEYGSTRAITVIPLVQAGRWQGILTFNWDQPHTFNEQEKAIYNAMISLATPAVLSQRLLNRTQTSAQREQALRQITAAVRSSTDPATIMRTAVRELGTTLGRKAVIKLEKTHQATEK